MGSRGIFKRTVTYNRDEEWLREKIQAMSWAIESFTVSLDRPIAISLFISRP
jgi:hypothetical protein